MDTMRIGLGACGGHGYNLAQAVARAGSLELVACADVQEPAAGPAAEASKHVGVHGSAAELLASCDVDALLIAMPHDVLAPTALAAMRAGRHVLVEKPMAMNALEAWSWRPWRIPLTCGLPPDLPGAVAHQRESLRRLRRRAPALRYWDRRKLADPACQP
jgi:hypothetical protein